SEEEESEKEESEEEESEKEESEEEESEKEESEEEEEEEEEFKKKNNGLENPNSLNKGVFRTPEPKTIAILTEKQFSNLDELSLKAITIEQAKSLTQGHIDALISVNKLHFLSRGALGAIGEKISFKKLTAENLNSLYNNDSKKVQKIPEKVRATIRSELYGDLEDVNVAKLTKEDIKNKKICSALMGKGKLQCLSDEVLKEVDIKINDEEQLTKLIEKNKIKNLNIKTITQIPDRVFNFKGRENESWKKEFQEKFIEQLTAEQLDAMAEVNGDGPISFLVNKKICALEKPNSIGESVFIALEVKTIATLTGKQFSDLDEPHLKAITTEQVKSLTQGHIDALISVNKLHFLSEEALGAIGEGISFRNLTAENLNSLYNKAPEKVQKIPEKVRATIGSGLYGDLKDANVAKLTEKDIKNKKICSALVEKKKLQFLTDEVLKEVDIKINSKDQLTKLIEAEKISHLKIEVITKIDDRTIKNLDSSPREKFTKQLTAEQLDAMAEVNGDGLSLFFVSKKICALEDLNSIDKKVFNTLAPKTIATLTNKQVGALDEEHIGAIATEQAKSLTQGQIDALIFENKLQYLSEDTLKYLFENQKIKSLKEEQLKSLVDSKKLASIPESAQVISKSISEKTETEVLEALIKIDFNHISTQKIELSKDREKKIREIIAEEKSTTVLNGRTFKANIEFYVKSEEWEDMAIKVMDWIAKSPGQRKTIVSALYDQVSLRGDIYSIIDDINLLKLLIPLEEKKAAKGHLTILIKCVHNLATSVEYDSVDKYDSALDTLFSLASDDGLDIGYRELIAEEMIKLIESFTMTYYGGKDPANAPLPVFFKEKFAKIYLKYAEIIQKNNDLNIEDLFSKKNTLDEHQLKYMSNIINAYNICPPQDVDSKAVSIRAGLTPFINAIESALVTGGAFFAVKNTLPKILSTPITTLVVASGATVTTGRILDASELSLYTGENSKEAIKKSHTDKRKESKASAEYPTYIILASLRRVYREIGKIISTFLYNLLNKKKKERTGFDSASYRKLKNKIAKECNYFAENYSKKLVKGYIDNKIKARAEAIKNINGVLEEELNYNKEYNDIEEEVEKVEKVRKLNKDADDLRQKALKYQHAKANLKLIKDYPEVYEYSKELRKEKSSEKSFAEFSKDVINTIGSVMWGVFTSVVPSLMNLESEKTDQEKFDLIDGERGKKSCEEAIKKAVKENKQRLETIAEKNNKRLISFFKEAKEESGEKSEDWVVEVEKFYDPAEGKQLWTKNLKAILKDNYPEEDENKSLEKNLENKERQENKQEKSEEDIDRENKFLEKEVNILKNSAKDFENSAKISNNPALEDLLVESSSNGKSTSKQ
ncbi:MAG: hypothetical protein LBI70_01760, partial [Rickettsiales bacterium]|nr:hypothetical protein [Rickettsiales bacterium]